MGIDQRIIAFVLRAGLVLSALLLATGAVVHIVEGRTDAPAVRMFEIFHAPDVGSSIVALGVLVLAATPAARVIALFILWLRDRDWRFAGVAFVVACTLAVSIVLGRG